ncbi:hypothetical protein AB0J83_39675 [Actinoplanes sp. NPDC049596]|uniref:hypothetical protein n=1 Tax=unclassified Actinoplanes TaxID=2626549 RepID=UPI003438E1CB
MASELAAAEYAFLILLKAAGRELSNTEMDKRYRVRLISPAYERLNAAGYVSSDTTHRPYRHAITKQGLKVLSVPLAIDEDGADGEKRSTREKQLWAALVAQQNEIVGRPVEKDEEPVDLEGRVRAAYVQLADGPGAWIDLAVLRPLLPDVSKADLDEALVTMLGSRDVRLEPDSMKHRVDAEARAAAVRVGGEDRHKLAIGSR